MTEQTKLEVSIPYTFPTDGWMNGRFRAHIRWIMREQHGGEDLSRFRKEPLSLFIHATFRDRRTALNAAKAIRRLALEHATESANDFTYIIDNDELLLFNNTDNAYSFESGSVIEEMGEWLDPGCCESPVVQ